MLTRQKQRRWQHLPKNIADEVTRADPFGLLLVGLTDVRGGGFLGVFDCLHNVYSADDDVHLLRPRNGMGAQLHSCHVASGARGTLLTASPIWSTPAGATTFDCRSAPSGNG